MQVGQGVKPPVSLSVCSSLGCDDYVVWTPRQEPDILKYKFTSRMNLDLNRR